MMEKVEKRPINVGSFEKLSQAVRVESTALFNFRHWCDEEGLGMVAGFDSDEVAPIAFKPEETTKAVETVTAMVPQLEEFIRLLKDVHTDEEISAIESKHEERRQKALTAINENSRKELEGVEQAKANVAESFRVRQEQLRAEYEEKMNKAKVAQTEATPVAMSSVFEEE